MTRKKNLQSNKFNFENVVQRLRQAELHRKRQLHIEAMRSKSSRNSLRPRGGAQPQPRVSTWSALWAGLRNESRQLFVASVILLGFAGWLCSAAQALYAQHTEALLAAGCHQNQLHHAGDTYCFDDRRIVHTLNPDGTATKSSGPDWRVNEAALRRVEAAAAHEALEARDASAAARLSAMGQ